jgi:hypothetical protein
MSVLDDALNEFERNGGKVKRVKHIPVETTAIDTPQWMNPQYDYTVRWDKYSQGWQVVPF